MESPLSFDSTENFRKKLLVKNLQPYKVDGSFASSKIDKKEITLVDYSVSDSPDISVEQKRQEEKLIKQNKFNPGGTFGNVIQININKGTETNGGLYGFKNTEGSKLEVIGDNTEKLLYVQNIYGPTQFANSFGNPVNINKNTNKSTNEGLYGFEKTFGSDLELIGDVKENELIVKNQYGPDQSDNRNVVNPNLNNQTKPNEGHYDFIDTLGSDLEKIGIFSKESQIIINQYGPQGPQSNTTVTPNLNFQSKANEGNYGPADAVSSELELKGDAQESILRVLNKYNPESVSTGFGDSKLFPTLTLGVSNYGEYDDASDAANSELNSVGNVRSKFLYGKNKYGLGSSVTNYGGVININKDNTLGANAGPYEPTENSGNNSKLERIGDDRLKKAVVKNPFQPVIIPDVVVPNRPTQTQANKGEYDFTASQPGKTTEQSQSYNYGKNLYNTGDGTYDPLVIEEIFPDSLNRPYSNSDTTFSFVPSFYSPINILNSDNPNGTEGSLSQDSNLAKIAAKQLQKEFRTRVAYELYQQTLGRSILSNSSVSTISGGIGPSPSIDPFDILGVVTNNVPLIQKNYQITSPSTIVGDVLGFTARLSGLYSPYSIIPGEYFDYPDKNFGSQMLANPIGAIAGAVGNLVNNLLSANIDTGSERLLANTSRATRSLLFDMLFYNSYRPDYNLDSLVSPNLSSPKPNFYIGNTKNFVRDIVSPKLDQPKGRDGKPNNSPVFDYGVLGKEFEGNDVNKRLFGINTRNYYNGSLDTLGVVGNSSFIGNFTWTTSESSYIKPGLFVGFNNKIINSTDVVFDTILQQAYNDSKSSKLSFTDGSILDITQKLIDAGAKSSSPNHVGNAINQVTKVFNDGYQEMTKGSRVFRYVTPTSIQVGAPVSSVQGYEYCRLFTKDRPYSTYKQLQKNRLNNGKGNIRGATYSVLDATYNLNIAPMYGEDSTNIGKDGKVKKYMFSIENLAWRTSSKPGFTVDSLPGCEIGPNGGRIMWFPPYELSFDDNVRTSWKDNVFLGRPEPIYTYQNTERTGTLKWKIVVDHPSIMNVLVNKELSKENTSVATKVIDSFIAGCTEYDIYDLLKKYKSFSLSDIYDVIETVSNVTELIPNVPNPNVVGEVVIQPNVNIEETITGSENTKTQEENIQVSKFQNIQLLFENAIPASTDTSSSYEKFYTELSGLKSSYLSGAANKIYNYNGTVVANPPANFGLKDFLDTRQDSLSGVFSFLDSEYDTFKELLSKIIKLCDGGNKITLDIIGSANSTASAGYNQSLSGRRADSVIKMITDYTEGELKMKDMVDKKLLIFNRQTNGETQEIDETDYRGIECSKPFNNQVTYKQSVQGMMCRRTKVGVANVEPPAEVPPTTSTQVSEAPEGDINPLGADVNNDNDTQPQTESSYVVKQTQKKTLTNEVREGITKRLLRKLLSECSYFEMIREENPMIYDGIRSKIKNFNPVFHSITPEGLNARLTFLQQCMRPGDTIPTAVETGQNTTTLQYNDVTNSAFGSPPICVIRVGDFFHTKVVFESLDLKFDDAVYDLNPEGIGVQPMIAEVTMSMKFIGGQGLREPIAKLQNALSFNYYANTEMYDERAEETEQINPKFEKQLIDDIKNEIGDIGPQKRPEVNDGGVTLGVVENTYLDVNTSQIKGTIRYKEVMDTMVDKTENYINGVYSTLQNLKTDLLWGGLILYTSNTKYKTGLFNYLLGNITNNVNIFGKPNGYQDRVDKLFNGAKDDVEDETSPILGGLGQENFPTNGEIRKVKRKIKEMIDSRKNDYLQSLEKNTSKLVKSQLEFIKYSDQVNYILSDVDGYKNKSGAVVVYDISGTTEIAAGSTAANTYDELRDDFLTIRTDINGLNDKFGEYQLIPKGVGKEYNDDFNFDTYIDSTSPKDVRFFLIFGKEILEDTDKFINEIMTSIPDAISETGWKKLLYQNIGITILNQGLAISFNNVPQKTYLPNGRYKNYEKSKKTLDDNFNNFKNTYFSIKFPNDKYISFNKGKTRLFDLTKQDPVSPPNDTNLLSLWDTVDSTGDQFNLKKTMN